jgi:hypothetical protein
MVHRRAEGAGLWELGRNLPAEAKSGGERVTVADECHIVSSVIRARVSCFMYTRRPPPFCLSQNSVYSREANGGAYTRRACGTETKREAAGQLWAYCWHASMRRWRASRPSRRERQRKPHMHRVASHCGCGPTRRYLSPARLNSQLSNRNGASAGAGGGTAYVALTAREQ